MQLLSVVLPTRDRAALLAEQLRALAGQDYDGDWELLVVDNSSTDETSTAVASFGADLPVRVVPATAKCGAAYARNVGATAARGDYLLFVDDDDHVRPGWLAAMASAAAGADIICGRDRCFRPDDRGIEVPVGPETSGLRDVFGFLPCVSCANSGLRRDLFEKAGGFNERYKRLEDTDLFWRAQLLSPEPPVFVPDAVLDYRLRTGMWTVFAQAFTDNEAVPALFRDFRKHGMERQPIANPLRGWKRVVLNGPRWLRTPEGRVELATHLGWLIGRLVGSARQHVLFL